MSTVNNTGGDFISQNQTTNETTVRLGDQLVSLLNGTNATLADLKALLRDDSRDYLTVNINVFFVLIMAYLIFCKI